MKILNNKNLFQRKKTVFISWVVLFCAMFLVALMLMGIYFYSINNVLENNLIDYNKSKMHQIKTEFDTVASKLTVIADSISNKEEINREEPLSYDEKRKLITELALQLETNRDIFEIMIYLPDTDEMITGSGSIKRPYFYSGYLDSERISAEQWDLLLENARSHYYCFLPMINLRSEKNYKLTYALSLNDGGRILIAMNTEKVLAEDPYFSKLFVVDENNDTYCVFGTVSENESFPTEFQAGKSSVHKADNGSYVSYADSAIFGMKYMAYTEQSVFNRDLWATQKFSALYMFLFLILGLILAWCFSIRQYKPISGIINALERVSDDSSENINEYAQIESSISRMIKESEKLSREARKRNAFVRERAVVNLINGRILNGEMQSMLPILQGKMTIVRMMYTEENTTIFDNDTDLLHFAIKNVSEELFSQIGQVYPAEADGAICALIYLKTETEPENVYEIAQQFVNIMRTQLKIEAEVILGRIVTSAEQLQQVYNEILEASQLYMGSGEIIQTGILETSKTEGYTYSVQTEIDIISFIKNGDFNGVNEIFTREFSEFIKDKKRPLYLVRCFMIDIASTVLKAIGEICKTSDDEVNLQAKSIGQLFTASSVEEMESIVRNYMKEVCDFVIETNSQCSSSNCEEIKKYIKENFSDASMNVNVLAERFYLNASYLSNMFKRNTGMKLLEYINKVRVDEAKKLMIKNSKMSMEQVAEMVGFANSRSFRRIFLKYEDMPPSKFITHK